MSEIDLAEPEVFSGFFVVSTFLVAYVVEFLYGWIAGARRPLNDFLFMLSGMLFQAIIAGALIGAMVGSLAAYLWPAHSGSLAHITFWLAFPIILVAEGVAYYLVHRYAHEWRWLRKIHRTHHGAVDLNLSVLYRFNIFRVFLIPQIWYGAIAFYLGLGEAFVAAVLTTYTLNILSHASFRRDLWLREKMPFIEPAWQVFDKVITTPDVNHAYHASRKTTRPNGNYAVTQFIFDVFLDTARLSDSRHKKSVCQFLHAFLGRGAILAHREEASTAQAYT